MEVFFTLFPGIHGQTIPGNHFSRHENRGYTVIELMLVLTVMVILSSLTIPSLTKLVESNRLTAAMNHFSGALALTRSEAIKRNQQVVMCKSQNGTDCLKTGRWDQGWLIFVDTNHDRQHDDEETLIQIGSAIENGIKADYRGFGSSHYITYRPGGFTKTNGTFTFCTTGENATARALILMITGRVRISSTKTDGMPLICPE